MDPLTIALAAGAGYLLLRGAAGASGPATLSIDQLAAKYAGKHATEVPADVMQRFSDYYNSVRNSNAEGWVIGGVLPSEPAANPSWTYIVGKMPGPAAWTPNTWGPEAIMRRIDVKKSGGGFLGAIGTLAGGLVRTATGVKL